MNNGFWKGRRVLLTGHTGFKGSWLSLWLQRLGADLTGYALEPPTSPNLFDLSGAAGEMKSYTRDVRDLEALRDVVDRERPEVVFHMAAQSLVRRSYQEPQATYATNVMGTVNLLEAVRGSETVRAVVNVTSDKCYQNTGTRRGYREEDPMGGDDPYSSSKGCAELVTSAYRNSFFAPGDDTSVQLASARAGNVIGGGDWAADRLIPDIMQGMLEGREVAIRSPRAVRPWQFVLEPLAGYLLLAERLWEEGGEYAEGWNFGPPEESARSVGWIVERLTGRWSGESSWASDTREHPSEAHYLKLDSTKARRRLSWDAVLELPETLEWIVQWYEGYAQGADVRRLCDEQIERYEKRLCR